MRMAPRPGGSRAFRRSPRAGLPAEASTPTNAWRELAFDDSTWLTGGAPFHYGTNAAGGDDNLVNGTVLELAGDLYHLTDPDLKHYFTKFNKYTTLAAEEAVRSYDEVVKDFDRANKGKTGPAAGGDALKERQIEIIGEAVKRLSPELTASEPGVPWRLIAGARDRLIHGYFRVDLEMVWKTIHVDLPELHTQIKQLLEETRQ